MSFHLSQTPTLEAVANQDETLLAQDLEARVAEAVQQVQALAEVTAAAEAQTAAAGALAKLRSAERALTQQAKESRERIDYLSQAVLDALVEAAGSGRTPDAKKLSELASIETRARFLGRAIEHLAERRIPLAQIAALREEAHALLAEARATERLAQERAERVLAQMRDAVSEEMVLPIDMSKGVSGALLTRARSLKLRAVQVSENADQLERAFQDRYEHA